MYYKEEHIKKAAEIDIVDFCNQNNIDIYSDNSRYYRLLDHDSCVIDRRKNLFYWNSRGKGGNVINFVQEVEGTSFMGAMKRLLDEESTYESNRLVTYVNEPYEYSATRERERFDHARDYLIKERKIDPEIVDDLHEKGLIKQDIYNNILFLWKDYENVMGCSEQGTVQSDRFKRGTWKSVQRNSTANYGFNVLYGQPKHLKFYESSLDLLSYASLNKERLQDTWLISMEGLKHNTVFNYISKAEQRLKGALESVSLCVDNDKGGQAFIEKLGTIEVKRKDGTTQSLKKELAPNGKDWNDYLKSMNSKRGSAINQRYQRQLER